jgi:hypothetical protein
MCLQWSKRPATESRRETDHIVQNKNQVLVVHTRRKDLAIAANTMVIEYPDHNEPFSQKKSERSKSLNL